jgi:hypothetical protein
MVDEEPEQAAGDGEAIAAQATNGGTTETREAASAAIPISHDPRRTAAFPLVARSSSTVMLAILVPPSRRRPSSPMTLAVTE